jgi:hypothetical protein
MSTKLTLYLADDNVVILTGVTDPTGTSIVGATITGTIVSGTPTVTFGGVGQRE